MVKPDVGNGVGAEIWGLADGKEKDAVSLSRGRPVDGGDVYDVHRAIYKEGAGGWQREHTGRLYATKARTGQLRLVRFGGVLRYLVADAENKEFRQLGQIRFSTGDIKSMNIALKVWGASTAATILWKDVTIRAEGLEDTAARLGER
jgi:hypothetical protein